MGVITLIVRDEVYMNQESTREKLLGRIVQFQSETNLSDRAIGLQIQNNSKLLKNLRGGTDITTETMDKIDRFMNEYRSENVINTS